MVGVIETPLLGDEQVISVLDDAVAKGLIRYEKDRSDKNMLRDLFAHAALVLAGYTSIVVLEELDNQRNIDLTIDGVHWEVKSPEARGNGRQPLRFVEGNLNTARHQFREYPLTEESDTRVVFNNRYTALPDELVLGEVADQAQIQSIREVLYIDKMGGVHRA